jgi:RHS repeat-associated protein
LELQRHGWYRRSEWPAYERRTERPSGKQAAFVSNNGSLWQYGTVTPGAYALNFQAAQYSGNNSAQRVRVTLRGATSSKTFVWSGNTIAEERDSTGANVTKRYFAEGEQRVGGNDAGNYFYARDHLGSIYEVTNTSGNLVAQNDYSAWGKSVVTGLSMSVDFGFTGHYFHQPSGMNLALYRAYSPSLGRWISRDPIAERRGPNLYAYVSNDPTNRIDRLGLRECWPGPAPGELYLPPVPLYLIPEGESPVIPNPTFPVTGCLIARQKCYDCCATEYATCPTNGYDQHRRCETRCDKLYEYCKDTQH